MSKTTKPRAGGQPERGSKRATNSRNSTTKQHIQQTTYIIKQYDTDQPKHFSLYSDFRGVCYLYPCMEVEL